MWDEGGSRMGRWAPDGPMAPAGVGGAWLSCVRRKDQLDQLDDFSSAFPGAACSLMHPLV